MTKKFTYGYDVNNYIDKAIEKMKFTYPWVTKEMFNNNYSYAIEKTNNRYQFVSYYYWDKTRTDREVHNCDGEKYIDIIIGHNRFSIERANPVKDKFVVPIECGIDAHGWTLEHYYFFSHVLGGYSSEVQAGNRSTGGTREFFIPPSYFEGTYSDFLDKYCELVPGSFGLYRSDLEKVKGLKEFLGF